MAQNFKIIKHPVASGAVVTGMPAVNAYVTNELPDYSNADAGKILTVDANGNLEFAQGGGSKYAHHLQYRLASVSDATDVDIVTTIVTDSAIPITDANGLIAAYASIGTPCFIQANGMKAKMGLVGDGNYWTFYTVMAVGANDEGTRLKAYYHAQYIRTTATGTIHSITSQTAYTFVTFDSIYDDTVQPL